MEKLKRNNNEIQLSYKNKQGKSNFPPNVTWHGHGLLEAFRTKEDPKEEFKTKMQACLGFLRYLYDHYALPAATWANQYVEIKPILIQNRCQQGSA